MLLLSSIYSPVNSGELSREAAALNKEIEALQSTLQEKVEAFNAQVEQDAENHSPVQSENAAPKETKTTNSPTPPTQSQNSDIEKLNKRVTALELEVNNLKTATPKPQLPLDEARTPEEATATKKANEAAPALPSTPAIAQYNQALTLLNNKELEKAAIAFEQILKDHPNDPYAHKAQVHLGDVLRQLGKMDEAGKNYRSALTHDLGAPLMIQSRLGLTEVSIALKDLKTACDQLKIVQKEEGIDGDQKKRLQELLSNSSCQKQQ